MVMQLAVNESTVAQLEQVAREQNTTPQRLAEQAIREFLRSEARRTMQREMNAFAQFHAQLLEDYSGQYVAIHQGKLVDHDSDQLALYQRVERRYLNTPVLIKQVLANPEEEYTFRSPTLEGAP